MTTEWNGPVATRGDGTPAQRCKTDNRPANEPSLPAMTKKAIDSLQGDRDGFFLQVEGASIDKQDHAANACAQIGETIAFDNAIKVAQEYARSHPDTLIVVTADHAHTSQIVARTRAAPAPDGLLEQPHHRRRPDAPCHVRHGRRRDAARGPAEPAAHRLRGARVRLGPRRCRGARHDGPHGPLQGPRRRARTPLAGTVREAGPRKGRPRAEPLAVGCVAPLARGRE